MRRVLASSRRLHRRASTARVGAFFACALAVVVAMVSAPARASVLWCVGAGAPMRGEPILDRRGRIYVTTTDGHVHAFEADGRFRWSYTVSGAVMGRSLLRNFERSLVVGTSDRWLLAVTEKGRLDWAAQLVTPIMSGLVGAPDRSIVFVGGDGYVYSLTPGGTARWRTALGGFATNDPFVADDGVVWVSAGRELLRLEGAWRAHRSALPGEARSAPMPFGNGVAVVAGNELLAFDAKGRGRFSKPNVAYAAASGAGLVTLSPEGRVERVDSAGRSELVMDIPDAPSAAPVVDGSVVYVPLLRGALGRVGVTSATYELTPVGRGALGRPVIDAERQQAVVEVGGGRVCAVDLRRGSR